jgi:O-antigen/teichoic acid export membrane protein
MLWLSYATTYLATLGVMVTGMMTYRLASLNYGADGFSEYALARRVISFIQPLLALGIAVSLSRKVAGCRLESHRISETGYLSAGFTLILASSFAFSLLLLCFPRCFAQLCFGSSEYALLTMAMAPMFLGICLHFVCYAHLHGRFRLHFAGLVQFLNIGLIPMLFVVWSMSIPAVLFWTGIAMSLVSLIGIGLQFYTADDRAHGVLPAIGELLRFGPRRVTGDLAFAALMLLPAALVTHTCDVRLGGQVAFCITLLALAQTTTAPVSTILLPQATQMLRSGRLEELRINTGKLLCVALGITALGTLFFFVATDLVLRICLGSYARELPGLTMIVMLGALPLNCHTCLRSIIDAGKEQAVNARSACLGLIAFILTWICARLIVGDLYAAPVALVVALYCLAMCSSLEAWQILKPNSIWAEPVAPLAPREAA